MATIVAGNPAINTLVEIQTGSPPAFRTVANMGDITGPAFALALVDVTSHSTGQPWDQFLATIFSGGDIAFPFFFVPSSGDDGISTDPIGHDPTTGIMQVFLNRIARTWQIIFPDAPLVINRSTAGPLQAILYKFNWKMMVKDVLRADTTMRVTGQPTLTFGT
jgi:hypothetical protein